MKKEEREIMMQVSDNIEYIRMYLNEIIAKSFQQDEKLYNEFVITRVYPVFENFIKQHNIDMRLAACILGAASLSHMAYNLNMVLKSDNFVKENENAANNN